MTQEAWIYTQEWMEKEAEIFLEWMKKPESVFYKMFAFERGYSAVRLTEFASKCKAFAEAMEIANQWQEAKLLNESFWQRGSSKIATFVLGAKYGYKDPNTIAQNLDKMRYLDGKSEELVNDKS